MPVSSGKEKKLSLSDEILKMPSKESFMHYVSLHSARIGWNNSYDLRRL